MSDVNWQARAEAADQELAQAQAEVERLRGVLSMHADDALEDVEHWGGYAGDYFAEKWGLSVDVAKWKRRRDLYASAALAAEPTPANE